MKICKIGIFGFTNTGKSTLFNCLTKKKSSIESFENNTTRDYISSEVKYQNDYQYVFFDTPGLTYSKNQFFSKKELDNYLENIFSKVDVFIFLVDASREVYFEEELFWKRLIKQKKPLFLIINKIDIKDNFKLSYYKFKFNECVEISASNNRNIHEIFQKLKKYATLEDLNTIKNTISFGLFGKINSGKSTFLNNFLSEKRSFTSSNPKTTINPLYAEYVFKDYLFKIWDTPGIIKKSKIDSKIDYVTSLLSEKLLKNIDFILYFVAFPELICKEDKKFLYKLEDLAIPKILIINKYDLKDTNFSEKNFLITLKKSYPNLFFYKIIFWTSFFSKDEQITKVKTLKDNLSDLLISLKKEVNKEINPEALKDFFLYIGKNNFLTKKTKNKLKILFVCQKKNSNKIIINIRINDKKLLTKNYQKFLKKKFIASFDLKNLPVLLNFFENKI
ncbi:GTP-binding protein [symbiont of Argiope bruennichi]|uniref:GTP-binding protein n=1 Tax=symbiont of Argiope bruennichi TaxID=2810479 RepID=UPI003DA33008